MPSVQLPVKVRVENGPPRGEPPEPKPREYYVCGMGPTVRAHFAQLQKESAWAELDRQSAAMRADRYLRMEQSIMRDMTAGAYEWGGAVHRSTMDSPGATRTELLARMRASTPDASWEDADAVINELGWERVEAVMREADGPALPKGQAPTGPKPDPLTTSGSSDRSSAPTPASAPGTSAD